MPCHELPELKALKERFIRLLDELRTAIELSVELKARSPSHRTAVVGIWEEFLRALVEYVRERARAGGENPFADLSFHRVWKGWETVGKPD